MDELKELKRGLGREQKMFGEDYTYQHICTLPETAVDEKSTMVCDYNRNLSQYAKNDAHGIIQFPRVLIDQKGVEMTVNGNAFTLKWNFDV